jgi:hypothetical protein
VSPAERRERLGQSGAVVVLSGGVAPSELMELAYSVERALFDVRRVATVVTAAAGSAPVVARELARAGLVAIVAGPGAHPEQGNDDEPVLEVRVFGEGAEAGSGTGGALSVSIAGAGTEAAAARIVAALLENEKNGQPPAP